MSARQEQGLVHEARLMVGSHPELHGLLTNGPFLNGRRLLAQEIHLATNWHPQNHSMVEAFYSKPNNQ
jgi:hypothetical protein